MKGERKSSKLCISNPGLRTLVAADAVAWLKKNPQRDCISIEPTDGGGWCECEECAMLGSISDRAVLLANEVAAAVQQEFGDTKLVGMLAYYQHCAPPTLPVHPLVNVSVATAFNSLPVNDMIAGWKAKGASIGIYDYYSVSTWWRDMPGRTNASNLDYLQESIPRFHALGARYFSAESGDNWGVNGLGYVFAARLLWDVDEANRKEAIVDEFLTNCFGPAKAPMAEFYRLIDGSHKEVQLDDLVGRMYRALAQARRSCDDPAIIARIDQLILYTRYVELFKAYQAAKGEERQAAFETVMRYIYRLSKTGIIHSLALYEDIPPRDKNVTMPKEADWQVPEGKNPWKTTEPFTPEEIAQYLENGIANHPLQPFTPVEYSRNLVPATPLKLPAVPTGQFRSITPDAQSFYTWVAPGQKELKLQVNGVRTITLYAGVQSQIAIDRVVVNRPAAVKTPLTAEDTIILHPKTSGLHRIERSGGAGGTEIGWDNLPMTFPAHSTKFNYSDTILLYFYVPKGTRDIIGYGTSLHGAMLGPDGTQRLAFKDVVGTYYTVPVPPGQDGTLWALKGIQGPRPLYTVPPYLARNAEELLLPAEVVKQDSPTPSPAKK